MLKANISGTLFYIGRWLLNMVWKVVAGSWCISKIVENLTHTHYQNILRKL